MRHVRRIFRAALPPCAAVLLLAVRAAAGQDDEVARLRKQAAGLMQLQRHGEAAELLRQVDGMTQGTCPECLMDLARAYAQLGAHKNAADTAQRVIAMHPEARLLGPAYEMLATGLARRGAREPYLRGGAEDAYRRAIEIDGGARTLARYGLGVLLLQVGRDVEGKAELETYLKLEPKGPRAPEAQRLIDDPGCARAECAPDFSWVSLDGQYLTLKDLRGKVVLLDFWATWCPFCRESVPALRRLARAMGDRPFAIIGISSDSNREAVTAFVDKEALAWPQVWDERHQITQVFGIAHYPTRLLISHEGRVIHRTSGWNEAEFARLSAEARKAVAEASKALKSPPQTGASSAH